MSGKKRKALIKVIEEIALENDVGGLISEIHHKGKKVYPETEEVGETFGMGIRKV